MVVRTELTPGELKYFDLIREGNFNRVSSKQLSQLVNSAFNNVETTEEMKKGVLKAGILWLQNDRPNEPLDALNKNLVQRIKQKTGYKKTTRELRGDERNLWVSVKEDLEERREEQRADEDEQKHDGDDAPRRGPIPPARAAAAPMDATQAAAAAAAAQAALKGQEDEQQGEPESDGFRSMVSQYLDTGSDYYKKNQKKINQALKALQPKNFQDGSWLTKLVSLEFPAVGVLQEVSKVIPGVSFSKDDSSDWAKMLSNDPDVSTTVSPDRAMELMFKSLANPDQIGVLVSKTASAAASDVEDWWLKLTGQPRKFDESQQSTADKIEQRRQSNKKNKEKNDQLDEWFDKAPDDPTVDPGKRTPDPLPDEWDELSPYALLFPPESEMGISWEDFADFKSGLLGISSWFRTPTSGESKEDYINYLRQVAPDVAMSYATALEKHDRRVAKAGVNMNDPVNIDASRVYLSQSTDMTSNLVKESVEAGLMDREAAGKLMDAIGLFSDVSKGEIQISNKDLNDLQKQLFNAIPREVLDKNKEGIEAFIQMNEEYIKPGWDGDSDLGNFDWLRNLSEGKDEEGNIIDGDDDKKPKEKIIRPPMQEPKYRYRGKWGNTDTLFQRSDESIAQRNLILEVQRLREDLDTTNKLIQSQLMTEERRFNSTFKMPAPEPYVNKSLPPLFKKEHRAIFQPQLINPIRDPYRNMRQEDLSGQYQLWSDRVPETTARAQLMQDPLIYPSNADLATGGEEKEVSAFAMPLPELRFGKNY